MQPSRSMFSITSLKVPFVSATTTTTTAAAAATAATTAPPTHGNVAMAKEVCAALAFDVSTASTSSSTDSNSSSTDPMVPSTLIAATSLVSSSTLQQLKQRKGQDKGREVQQRDHDDDYDDFDLLFYDALEHHDHDESEEFGRNPLLVRGGAAAFQSNDDHYYHNYPQQYHPNQPPPPPPPQDNAIQKQQQQQQQQQYQYQQFQQYQYQPTQTRRQIVPPPPKNPPPVAKQQQQQQQQRIDYDIPPQPPAELPDRFLRAGKGDPVEGMRRYKATLAWRKQYEMDYIIKQPHPDFATIKKYYPHYFHLRGRHNEPVFYDKPPKTDLRALRKAGVDITKLLRHYAMVTEFGWQVLERDDHARSISVIDLQGIRMTDFVGECVDFVRKASAFTGAHYPERAGCVFVVNVPTWFHYIWKVVKPMVDPVTLEKIKILRDPKEIFRELLQKIPVENIPPEYGGQSVPLGQSPEEAQMWAFMNHNNAKAKERQQGGPPACLGPYDPHQPCPICRWVPARAY